MDINDDSYDDDMEEWDECDVCKKYKVQVESLREVVAQRRVNRRSFIKRRPYIEEVYTRMIYDHIVQRERLCFGCYLARYGSETLGRLGIHSWVDQPAVGQRPTYPPEAVEAWEQEQADRKEALDRRESDWITRDQDMFDPESPTYIGRNEHAGPIALSSVEIKAIALL